MCGSGIDEPVHQLALRRHQLRVLAAARVDPERLAADSRRHLVGVEPRGVHDRAREDRSAGVRSSMPSAATSAPIERRARQQRHVLAPRRAAPACGPAPRLRGCRCSARTARRAPRTCGSRARMNAGVHHAQPLDAVASPRARSALERRDLVVVVRDDQLAAAACGTPCALAELVEQPRAVDAVPRLERARPGSRCRRE